ncbi:MAG: SDR family oxidoreductase [Gammaproteobacteria bacterium TMED236]|nr:MAG: SDR family oxidoreductase [Gammaproteobacteria bacterium TMED236]|tara:strand:- start:3384 stop:4148 length:765 start_codon:yes stop_codon:yes gene_type:complete
MSDNPVAIVTGGSRGVGAATAKMLYKNGWNVIITCSSSIEEAEKVAKECSNETAQVIALQADVSNDLDCKATINKAIEKWNRIDALINNAGTTKFVWDHSDLNSLDAEDFQHIYAVNVVGPFQMVKASKEHLLKSANPCVVNVSSIGGIKGIGSSLAYASSKGALNSMTLSMARNLGPIRVNAVCPGFIEGEWLKKGMGHEMYEAVKLRVQTTTPLKKTCTPESVAEVIVNLIETSELMTGQLVTVDGGASLNL